MAGGHRSDNFNATVLPHCRAMVEAIGQRMAYEAALHSDTVAPEVLDLFEICCIQEDPSWYIEHCNDTRTRIWETEERAFKIMLPLLPGLVDKVNAGDYITAPIVDGKTLETFLLGLPTFGNEERAMRKPTPGPKL
ncbi:hypothetical protein ColTof4_01261 [Colletotrichum tofieldiae]|nr:hypothetical protein ColTof3_08500 [Colletotrichum tofieldiae]GKT68838.1 hypothetical protein ColTof4_01261 [Colletotrichum tofieldiae]GKT88608.1 hypothetical protein Ct61P_06458 [Colletotrichum tofieldiae]